MLNLALNVVAVAVAFLAGVVLGAMNVVMYLEREKQKGRVWFTED